MEAPAAEQPPRFPFLGRVVALAVIVALCAGLVSGSCIAVTSQDALTTVVAAALAAGVALAASVLFFLLAPNLREMRPFATICVAGYIAAEFLVWFPFGWPGAIAAAIVAGGGGLCAWGSRGAGGRVAGITALISGAAIVISAVAIVWGFYANAFEGICLGWIWDTPSGCGIPLKNGVVFALIVGGAPPVVAAAAARICGAIYSGSSTP